MTQQTMTDQWHYAAQQPNPYYAAQQPAPKVEYGYYGGQAAATDGNVLPVTTATAAETGEKKICGISKTAFLLWCVVAFLIVSGAILGGVFGSGVLNKE